MVARANGWFGIALLAVGVFIGINLASNGMGSLPDTLSNTTVRDSASDRAGTVGTDAQASSGWVDAPLDASGRGDDKRRQEASRSVAAMKPAGDTAEEPQPLWTSAPDDGLLDRAARKTGGLLQITAEHGVRLVVSLFDKALD